ncbi:MAG: hypothetical protein M1819_005941 [Sarea resinae]|nr:MAG: hypothetical protein M1819_005941 [Sarea resinae]
MDPFVRFPASPGTPLFAISPERTNQQRMPQYGLPSSPSLPSMGSLRSPTNSEFSVKNRVAQFDSIDKDMATRKKVADAALKRAEMGREEAEFVAKTVKDELARLKKEVGERQEREKRVAERVDRLMEDLHRSKDEHRRDQLTFEKEIRKTKKDAFKSASILVKLQEELKATRSTLRLTQADLANEKEFTKKRDHDAFNAESKLAEVQQELFQIQQQSHTLEAERDELKQSLKDGELVQEELLKKQQEQVRTVEAERDALKKSLREEEVARIAAEGRIALPIPPEGDEFSSPKKKRKAAPTTAKPITATQVNDEEMISLKEQVAIERVQRENAEKLVTYMKLECQLRCCSCRILEERGRHYVHDELLTGIVAGRKSKNQQQSVDDKHEICSGQQAEVPQLEPNQDELGKDESAKDEMDVDIPGPREEDLCIDFSPTTGTFRTSARFSPVLDTAENEREQSSESTSRPPLEHSFSDPTTFSSLPTNTLPTISSSLPPNTPKTHTTTTTIKIPLAADNDDDSALTTASTTMTREEALEQIRQRRGRARSMAAGTYTPRKQMVEGAGVRRDISAPAMRVWKGGRSATK